MDPWSKVELLTEHPGGNHGDGGASGDQSSLRQGAEIGSSGEPKIGIATAAGQWIVSRNGGLLEGFWNKR